MSEHPLKKLVKVLDYKIGEHQLQLDHVDLKEEVLKKKITKGLDEVRNGAPEAAILVQELILSKDKVIFHKSAIAALADIKQVIEDATTKS